MWRNVDVSVLSPLVLVVLRTEQGVWVCRLTGNEISPGLTLAVFRERKSYCTGEGLPSFKRKYDCLVKKKSSSNNDLSLGLQPCFAEMQSTMWKLQSAELHYLELFPLQPNKFRPQSLLSNYVWHYSTVVLDAFYSKYVSSFYTFTGCGNGFHADAYFHVVEFDVITTWQNKPLTSSWF